MAVNLEPRQKIVVTLRNTAVQNSVLFNYRIHISFSSLNKILSHKLFFRLVFP